MDWRQIFKHKSADSQDAHASFVYLFATSMFRQQHVTFLQAGYNNPEVSIFVEDLNSVTRVELLKPYLGR